jgi:hypothetical protein
MARFMRAIHFVFRKEKMDHPHTRVMTHIVDSSEQVSPA